MSDENQLSDENYNQLLLKHHDLVVKGRYFLLAVTGAAVGFALNQTHDTALAYSHLPLGAAVLAWGGSFIMGFGYIQNLDVALSTNLAILTVTDLKRNVGPESPEVIVQKLNRSFDQKSKKGGWLAKWQYRLLLIGTGFYIAWHILEMALRNSASI